MDSTTTESNFKPILFSTEMVQAILAGRKTQTRRTVKNQPESEEFKVIPFPGAYGDKRVYFRSKNGLTSDSTTAKYQAGNILWVRETSFAISDNLRKYPLFQTGEKFMYKADLADIGCHNWKPSIYMAKEAARIFLKVTNVRVERLQDISEEDAIAEGIDRFENTLFNEMRYKDYTDGKRRDKDFNRYPEIAKEIGYSHFGGNPWPDWRDPISSFQTLWDSINAKKHPWESNPWIWVYEFERIEKPADFI